MIDGRASLKAMDHHWEDWIIPATYTLLFVVGYIVGAVVVVQQWRRTKHERPLAAFRTWRRDAAYRWTHWEPFSH